MSKLQRTITQDMEETYRKVSVHRAAGHYSLSLSLPLSLSLSLQRIDELEMELEVRNGLVSLTDVTAPSNPLVSIER